MASRLVHAGDQPSSALARPLEATSAAGSPARRGAISQGTMRTVTADAAAMTWRAKAPAVAHIERAGARMEAEAIQRQQASRCSQRRRRHGL